MVSVTIQYKEDKVEKATGQQIGYMKQMLLKQSCAHAKKSRMLDHGVTTLDTAPAYGIPHPYTVEEFLGKAIAEVGRDKDRNGLLNSLEAGWPWARGRGTTAIGCRVLPDGVLC